jgi:hypothetical protein
MHCLTLQLCGANKVPAALFLKVRRDGLVVTLAHSPVVYGKR